MHTRGIPTRNRRQVMETVDKVVGSNETATSTSTVVKSTSASPTTTTTAGKSTEASTETVVAAADATKVVKNETQRNRRQVPGCIVNYNAQRQLLIGCTQPEVIEVRPTCNEDGDESKFVLGGNQS